MIYCLLNIVYVNFIQVLKNNSESEYQNEIAVQEIENNTDTTENDIEEVLASENIWQIEIPKINLVAEISEGTSNQVIDKYVGHFENTSIWEGNVGLASHNRRI